MTTTEKIQIQCFWLKQYNTRNNLEDFLPEKLKEYSFLVWKIKLKDLLALGTSTMLKEFYSFNSDKPNLITIQNIDSINDNNLKRWLKNFLDNYSNRIPDIDALEQLKLGEESTIDEDSFLNIIPQRLTDVTRLSEIWQYLKYNDYPFLPNSFICAINLENWDISKDASDIVTVNIERKESSIFVIDWQHRLYGSLIKKEEVLKRGLMKAEEIEADSVVNISGIDYVLANKDMEVIISLMVNIPIELQASLFQIINFRTQRIRSSLYFDLFNFPINDLSQDELAHSIILNFYLKDKPVKKSAWYLIHLSEFYKKEDNKLYISQWSFAKKIQEYFSLWEIFYFYNNQDIKSKLFTKNEVRKYYDDSQISYYNKVGAVYTNFMYDYFAALKKEYKSSWEDSGFQVMKSTWVGVFMNLLGTFYCLDFIKKKKNIESFIEYSGEGDDENIDNIYSNLKWISEHFSFSKESLKSSAWFWIQGSLTKEIIQFLHKEGKLDSLLEKEEELKSFIQDDEIKHISCRDKIFNTKLRRYLKNIIANRKDWDDVINNFVPNVEYHAASILIAIWYIYYNLS